MVRSRTNRSAAPGRGEAEHAAGAPRGVPAGEDGALAGGVGEGRIREVEHEEPVPVADRFPFPFQSRAITIGTIELFVKVSPAFAETVTADAPGDWTLTLWQAPAGSDRQPVPPEAIDEVRLGGARRGAGRQWVVLPMRIPAAGRSLGVGAGRRAGGTGSSAGDRGSTREERDDRDRPPGTRRAGGAETSSKGDAMNETDGTRQRERAAAPRPRPARNQKANTFTLRGSDLAIEFAASDLTGKPRLDVTYGPDAAQRHFGGDEIERRRGETGLVLSVTLERVADGDSLALSVTLPTVNLGGQSAQAFRTFAVLTTIRGNIAGPQALTGALQLYRVVALRGRATFTQS